jgi:hypothetical protein
MKIKAEGKTDSERFDNAIKKILSVSKEKLNQRLASDPRGHVKPKKTRKRTEASK